MDRCRYRWQTACQRWGNYVCPFCWGQWILECTSRESLRQVGVLRAYSGSKLFSISVHERKNVNAISNFFSNAAVNGRVWFLLWYQVKRFLWGTVWRKHYWRFWGLHRWCVWNVRAPQSSQRSVQDNQQSFGQRLPAGLLYWCKCWLTSQTHWSMLHLIQRSHYVKSTIYPWAAQFILEIVIVCHFQYRSPVPLTWRLLHSRSLWRATPIPWLDWRRSVCVGLCCLYCPVNIHGIYGFMLPITTVFCRLITVAKGSV